MIPAAFFAHIDGLLNNEQVQLQSGIAEGFPLKTRTVESLVFDQNYVRGPIRDLVGNLDMLNVHSRTYLHFFLDGVSRYGANEEGAKDFGEMGGFRCTTMHKLHTLSSKPSNAGSLVGITKWGLISFLST